jgi:hypothetical protein
MESPVFGHSMSLLLNGWLCEVAIFLGSQKRIVVFY